MTDLQLVWFKRDLRVGDHAPLAAAAAHGPVLPLYVIEPELWEQPDLSARHWIFLRECLQSLRQELAVLGQPLIIRVGHIIDVLMQFLREFGLFTLWSHAETGNSWTYARDRQVRAWAKDNGVVWRESRQNGVVRGLKSRDGWSRAWDHVMAEPPAATPAALPMLSRVDLGHLPMARDLGLADDGWSDRLVGGSAAGLDLVDTFLRHRARRYPREMSSPNTAYHSCSRLSPHLAAGTISIRQAARATWRRIGEVRGLPPSERDDWLVGMRAFEGRLHWHCHFIQKLEDEPSIEFENQHPAYNGLREASFDAAHFTAWSRGETGFPFIDACMRAQEASGWINFRMRAMLASFAANHLWLHWRQPAIHLARLFVDYEPGIHYPQMQMQSGTTGINTPRIYNPVKQSRDQDPDGTFIRSWVPELAAVATADIHEPWNMSFGEQQRSGCVIGRDYPLPIVDHLAAARSARERIWSVRRGDSYRQLADDIQEKHGSRVSGLAPSNPARRRRPPPRGQISFDV